MSADTSRGSFVNVIGGLVFVGFAVFFLSLVVPRMYQLHQLEGAVSRSTGRVVELQSHPGHRGSSYIVSYTYPTGAHVQNVSETVDWHTYSILHVGDSIPVVYLPLAPDISRIDLPGVDHDEWRNAIAIGAFAMVFLVMGVWVMSRKNVAADARARWRARAA